jgi:predicted transposase YbfD/YdcC
MAWNQSDCGNGNGGMEKWKETRTLLHGSSLYAADASPERSVRLWRNHWSIENNLHRQRDVAFGEDQSTIRCGSSPHVMATLRNLIIFLSNKLEKSLADLPFLCSRDYSLSIEILRKN